MPSNTLNKANRRRRAKKLVAETVIHQEELGESFGWSAKTQDCFDLLSPLERGFALGIASGLSASEAYRRAVGPEEVKSPHVRQYAHALLRRPTVQMAIQQAIKEDCHSAAIDREFMICRLGAAINYCFDMGTPKWLAVMVDLIELLAKLQGEIPHRLR